MSEKKRVVMFMDDGDSSSEQENDSKLGTQKVVNHEDSSEGFYQDSNIPIIRDSKNKNSNRNKDPESNGSATSDSASDIDNIDLEEDDLLLIKENDADAYELIQNKKSKVLSKSSVHMDSNILNESETEPDSRKETDSHRTSSSLFAPDLRTLEDRLFVEQKTNPLVKRNIELPPLDEYSMDEFIVGERDSDIDDLDDIGDGAVRSFESVVVSIFGDTRVLSLDRDAHLVHGQILKENVITEAHGIKTKEDSIYKTIITECGITEESTGCAVNLIKGNLKDIFSSRLETDDGYLKEICDTMIFGELTEYRMLCRRLWSIKDGSPWINRSRKYLDVIWKNSASHILFSLGLQKCRSACYEYSEFKDILNFREGVNAELSVNLITCLLRDVYGHGLTIPEIFSGVICVKYRSTISIHLGHAIISLHESWRQTFQKLTLISKEIYITNLFFKNMISEGISFDTPILLNRAVRLTEEMGYLYIECLSLWERFSENTGEMVRDIISFYEKVITPHVRHLASFVRFNNNNNNNFIIDREGIAGDSKGNNLKYINEEHEEGNSDPASYFIPSHILPLKIPVLDLSLDLLIEKEILGSPLKECARCFVEAYRAFDESNRRYIPPQKLRIPEKFWGCDKAGVLNGWLSSQNIQADVGYDAVKEMQKYAVEVLRNDPVLKGYLRQSLTANAFLFTFPRKSIPVSSPSYGVSRIVRCPVHFCAGELWARIESAVSSGEISARIVFFGGNCLIVEECLIKGDLPNYIELHSSSNFEDTIDSCKKCIRSLVENERGAKSDIVDMYATSFDESNKRSPLNIPALSMYAINLIRHQQSSSEIFSGSLSLDAYTNSLESYLAPDDYIYILRESLIGSSKEYNRSISSYMRTSDSQEPCDLICFFHEVASGVMNSFYKAVSISILESIRMDTSDVLSAKASLRLRGILSFEKFIPGESHLHNESHIEEDNFDKHSSKNKCNNVKDDSIPSLIIPNHISEGSNGLNGDNLHEGSESSSDFSSDSWKDTAVRTEIDTNKNRTTDLHSPTNSKYLIRTLGLFRSAVIIMQPLEFSQMAHIVFLEYDYRVLDTLLLEVPYGTDIQSVIKSTEDPKDFSPIERNRKESIERNDHESLYLRDRICEGHPLTDLFLLIEKLKPAVIFLGTTNIRLKSMLRSINTVLRTLASSTSSSQNHASHESNAKTLLKPIVLWANPHFARSVISYREHHDIRLKSSCSLESSLTVDQNLGIIMVRLCLDPLKEISLMFNVNIPIEMVDNSSQFIREYTEDKDLQLSNLMDQISICCHTLESNSIRGEKKEKKRTTQKTTSIQKILSLLPLIDFQSSCITSKLESILTMEMEYACLSIYGMSFDSYLDSIRTEELRIINGASEYEEPSASSLPSSSLCISYIQCQRKFIKSLFSRRKENELGNSVSDYSSLTPGEKIIKLLRFSGLHCSIDNILKLLGVGSLSINFLKSIVKLFSYFNDTSLMFDGIKENGNPNIGDHQITFDSSSFVVISGDCKASVIGDTEISDNHLVSWMIQNIGSGLVLENHVRDNIDAVKQFLRDEISRAINEVCAHSEGREISENKLEDGRSYFLHFGDPEIDRILLYGDLLDFVIHDFVPLIAYWDPIFTQWTLSGRDDRLSRRFISHSNSHYWQPLTPKEVFTSFMASTRSCISLYSIVNGVIITGNKLQVRLNDSGLVADLLDQNRSNAPLEPGVMLTGFISSIDTASMSCVISISDITIDQMRSVKLDSHFCMLVIQSDFRNLRKFRRDIPGSTTSINRMAHSSIEGRNNHTHEEDDMSGGVLGVIHETDPTPMHYVIPCSFIKHQDYKVISFRVAYSTLAMGAYPIGSVIFRRSEGLNNDLTCLIKLRQPETKNELEKDDTKGNRFSTASVNNNWMKTLHLKQKKMCQGTKYRSSRGSGSHVDYSKTKTVFTISDDDEEFDELDQIKVSVVEPLLRKYSEFRHHVKFHNDHPHNVTASLISSAGEGNRIKYALALDNRIPCQGLLIWCTLDLTSNMNNNNNNASHYRRPRWDEVKDEVKSISEPVMISRKGYKIWDEPEGKWFMTVDRLIAWWKSKGFARRAYYVEKYNKGIIVDAS